MMNDPPNDPTDTVADRREDFLGSILWLLERIRCMKQSAPDWLICCGRQGDELCSVQDHCLRLTANFRHFGCSSLKGKLEMFHQPVDSGFSLSVDSWVSSRTSAILGCLAWRWCRKTAADQTRTASYAHTWTILCVVAFKVTVGFGEVLQCLILIDRSIIMLANGLGAFAEFVGFTHCH